MILAGTPGPGLNVDYKTLEWRALRQAGKSMNFGSPKGMSSTLAEAYGLTKNICKRCGARLYPDYLTDIHDRRTCDYLASARRYARLGYVPVTSLIRKALKHAGVELHWGTGRVNYEPALPDNLRVRGWTKKQKGPRPLQRTYYAPVWAVILYEQSGVGVLTSPLRQRVRELIQKIRRAKEDEGERALVLTEHILGRGPYTVACQAWIGRKR